MNIPNARVPWVRIGLSGSGGKRMMIGVLSINFRGSFFVPDPLDVTKLGIS
jgi:hypothetical protein